MKKFIIIFCCVIVLCVLLCIVDYVMVQNDNNPIFCIKVSDGHFIGLGYSFYLEKIVLREIKDMIFLYLE